MKIADELFHEIVRVLPIVCVDVPVVDSQGRVLLVKRANSPARGQWWFLGGRVHYGELRQAAAARKLLDECGLTALSWDEIGTHDLIFNEAAAPFHSVSTVYCARVADGDVRLDAQSSEYQWRRPDDWMNDVSHEFVRRMLKHPALQAPL